VPRRSVEVYNHRIVQGDAG